MKEQTLLEMKNKVETLGSLVQQIINELGNLKNLSVGTLETLKKIPGYEEAISKLVEEQKEKEAANVE
jgi:hypothetical protein